MFLLVLSLSVRQLWPLSQPLLVDAIGIPALYGRRAELRGRADSSGPHFWADSLLDLKRRDRIPQHFGNPSKAAKCDSNVRINAFGKFGADDSGGISLPAANCRRRKSRFAHSHSHMWGRYLGECAVSVKASEALLGRFTLYRLGARDRKKTYRPRT